MGELAYDGLNVKDFFEWVANQDDKYELVNGEPVLMAGANRRHDRISFNGQRIVGNQLQGHRCQGFTSDTYIAIPGTDTRRMADFGVDCGTPEDNSLEADQPALVVEILSPTTRTFDHNDKLEEYKTLPSLKYILLIDPDQPQIRLYHRIPGREWTSERIAGLDAIAEMPDLGVSLSLAELYTGLTFRPRPTLVQSEETSERTI